MTGKGPKEGRPAAHQQLGGPIVLIWANLNTHVSKAMRRLVATREGQRYNECWRATYRAWSGISYLTKRLSS